MNITSKIKQTTFRFPTRFFMIIAMGLMFIPAMQAQKIKFGPRVGVSSPGVELNDLIIKDASDLQALKLTLKDASPEYQAGVFARVQLLGIYVQPEVLLSTSSITLETEGATAAEAAPRTEKYYNVEVPVMAGIKMGPVRAQAGPVFRAQLGNRSELVDIDGYGRKFQENGIGIQAGVGLDLGKKLTMDLKYEANFGMLKDEVTILGNTYELSQRKPQLVFAVGYSLF